MPSRTCTFEMLDNNGKRYSGQAIRILGVLGGEGVQRIESGVSYRLCPGDNSRLARFADHTSCQIRLVHRGEFDDEAVSAISEACDARAKTYVQGRYQHGGADSVLGELEVESIDIT